MPCSHARECEIYKAVYGEVKDAFPEFVLSPYGKAYTCDAIRDFKDKASKGPARLTDMALQYFECDHLFVLNRTNQQP